MTGANGRRFRLTDTRAKQQLLEKDADLLRKVEGVPGVFDSSCSGEHDSRGSAGFAGSSSGKIFGNGNTETNSAGSAASIPEEVSIRNHDEWPDPVPIGGGLPPVEKFEFDLLPVSFRPMIEDISERMQIPPDFAAAAAVVALAGCVNRRAVIRPKREDNSWAITPNLWGAMCAPPGFMKSPVLQAVTAPLVKIEDLWRALYDQEAEGHEGEQEKVGLRHDVWTQEYKQAVKRNLPIPVAPDLTLRTPARKRLVLTDATFEKLHEILSENPAGVFVSRDELTGWLAELDRPGRDGERAFYLQAWNGDGGFTVDRIGRGSIYVPAVCVSLFGLIQPARLRSYLGDALAGGPTDDGLFQRFQILVWPDTQPEWHLVDRKPDGSAREQVTRIFTVLADLSSDSPVYMRFAPDAQALFYDWWAELEKKIRGENGLHPAIVSHLAKYRSLMPTLAGLFELADCVAEGKELTDIRISLDHARQAAAFCGYLESHAHRVYACLVSPEIGAARELAEHIVAGHLKEVFTTRDVYNKGWAGLDLPDRARAALRLLEDSDWLRQIERLEPAASGRPSELWEVNPKAVQR
jgi:hypothetical protein